MKKEMIYILVLIVLTLVGVLYKSIFLSETLDKIRVINLSNNESYEVFNRDSIVQSKIIQIKNVYAINKRDSRPYGEVIAELLKVTEGLLQKSQINYKGNDINQGFDEEKNYKSGSTKFVINLFFATDYSKLVNFLNYIEKSEYIINVTSLELIRGKSLDEDGEELQNTQAAKGEEIDKFNQKAVVNVNARIEFIKFL